MTLGHDQTTRLEDNLPADVGTDDNQADPLPYEVVLVTLSASCRQSWMITSKSPQLIYQTNACQVGLEEVDSQFARTKGLRDFLFAFRFGLMT